MKSMMPHGITGLEWVKNSCSVVATSKKLFSVTHPHTYARAHTHTHTHRSTYLEKEIVLESV
jgi:hypothetical protein